MKRTLVLSVLTASLLAVLAVPAMAQETGASKVGTTSKFGVGLGGGTMTSGLSAKYYLTEKSAVQATVGLNGWGTSADLDYVMEFKPLFNHEAGHLFWGAGAGVGAYMYTAWAGATYTEFSVSGIVELGWHFSQFPVEVVTDWRPTFVTGDLGYGGLYLAGSGGAIRYYF
jgi:hypothetical protein